MNNTITDTMEELRKVVCNDYGQTMLDEMDDEDVIIYALNFLRCNLDEEILT